MPNIEKVVKSAASQFVSDWSALLSPIDTICNHVEANLRNLEVSSRMALDQSRDRAEIYETTKQDRAEVYGRFLTLKQHYKTKSDREGQYVYYYLCSVESLPPSHRDAAIMRTTAFLTAAPDVAVGRISKAVQALCENVMLGADNQPFLLASPSR